MKKFVNNKSRLLVASLIIFLVSITILEFINSKYLYKNSSLVNVYDMSFDGLKLLNNELDTNTIFLSGEAHGNVKSIDMNLYLMKYFIENTGIRYILYEGGYAEAQYINMYLDTGNENILIDIFDSFRGTSNYTMEKYNFLKSVYEYNLTLNEDSKIKFVGIDKEIPTLAIKYIKSLIPNSTTSKDSVNNFITSLNRLNIHDYQDNINDIITLLSENSKDIELYFGEDFFDLSYTIRNLVNGDEIFYRDDLLRDNFIELYEYLPPGKYFGQFGSHHVFKERSEDAGGLRSLAYYIDNEYVETKGKVMTILYDYIDSKCYTSQFPEGVSISNEIPQKFYKEDGDIRLFKINQRHNPYTKTPMDKFQYIITFKNSDSASKYFCDR